MLQNTSQPDASWTRRQRVGTRLGVVVAASSGLGWLATTGYTRLGSPVPWPLWLAVIAVCWTAVLGGVVLATTVGE